MVPSVRAGSVALIRKGVEIEVGDVIAFDRNDITRISRAIDYDEEEFTIKADNNGQLPRLN